MSASTERKNRIAAREAGTDKKMLAQQEAAKKAAKSKRRWTLGTILVVVLLAVIILLNTGFIYTHSTAATVGERKVSPAELQYYYVNEYSNFLSQYGSYASLFGLDTSTGLAGLGEQECPMLGEGKTWRDYFLENAMNSLKQVVALSDYARANDIALDESDLAAIDEDFASVEQTAKSSGFANLNRFFSVQYGEGVSAKLVRSLIEESTLASKVMRQVEDSFSFSEDELEEYYASLDGSSDLFDYAYYYVAAEQLPVEGGEEGETAVTEDTLLEARMTAQAIETAYRDGADIADPVERFNAAIEAEFDADEATVQSAVSGGSLGDMSDWLRDSARKAGDLSVIDDSLGEGSYVVLFLARDDNHYPTVSVRHILIRAEAGEDGSYSDEAKQAALDKINEIKAKFESGDKSEESFAALAEKYSEDDGSNTNGGLYENIYKGEMVSEFGAFCFAPHKAGDLGVVYGENDSYAGYHLIYFVGEGELYSDLIARNALSSQAMNDFLAEQTEPLTAELGRRARLVK